MVFFRSGSDNWCAIEPRGDGSAAVSGVKGERGASSNLSAADAGHRRHIIALGLIALLWRRLARRLGGRIIRESPAEIFPPCADNFDRCCRFGWEVREGSGGGCAPVRRDKRERRQATMRLEDKLLGTSDQVIARRLKRTLEALRKSIGGYLVYARPW